ncbi:hypothetical protein [Paracoccus luteus]|uniref:hypothetical protein n=1 Tax=Paracoccus luteus TaxID=2508543 RepID=UPI00106F3F11|nr:hypothetical protein [Paracoccus luteus]
MNRRALLKAAPALALAGAVPAGAEDETPVAALFREWKRLNADVWSADKADDNDAFERAHDARWVHEQILMHEPSRCERDVLLKIAAWTDTGEADLEVGNPHLATVWAELRAMFGAPT